MRSDIRYEVSSASSVRAFVDRVGEVPQEAAEVLLLDLSRRGAKLGTDNPLPVQGRLSMRLTVEAIGMQAQSMATVCWSRPVGGNQWWVGVAFDAPLAEREIAQLAAGGFIERRQNSRHPYELEAAVRWESESRSERVVLKDLSSGGFGLELARKPNVGDRILLSLELDRPREQPLLARVQWYRRIPEGYRVGCTFLQREGHAEAQRRIARRNPVEAGAACTSRRKRRWLFFLTGVALCGAATCWRLW